MIYYITVISSLDHTTKSFFRNISCKAKFILPVLFLSFLVSPVTAFATAEAPERSLNDHLTAFGTNFSPSKDDILNAKASGIVYFGPADENQGGFDKDGNLKKLTTVVNLNINTSLPRAWNMIGGEYTGADLNTKKHSYGFLKDQETFLAHIYQREGADNSGPIINEAIVPLPSTTFVDDAWKELGPDGETKFKKDRTPLNRIVKIIRQAGASYNFGNAAEDGYTGGDGSTAYILGIGTGYILGGKVGAIAGAYVANLLNTSEPKLAGQQRALLYLDISSNSNYKDCRICKTATLEKGKKTYMDIWYLGSPRVSSDRSYPGGPASPAIAIYRAHSPYTQLVPAGFSYDYGGIPLAYNENTGELITDPKDVTADKLKRRHFFEVPGATQAAGDRMADFNFTYKEFPDENAKMRNLLKIALDKDIKDIHFPYFKIGGTVEFTTPTSYETAVAAADEAKTEADKVEPLLLSSSPSSVLPLCSILPTVTDGSVMGCVAQILYHGVFRPVAFFAQLMGKLFDFFLGYSLSDESYRHDFVQTGWQLVRDISNIFFIVIMIWTGLMAVFNTSNVSYKKVIPALIINALIINFSLFATRVVIDISNITARIFYNQMVVKVNGDVQDPSKSVSGYKPISEAIVSSFNPQSIFSNMVLDDDQVGSGTKTEAEAPTNVDFNSNQSSSLIESSKFEKKSKEYAGYFALVTLVAIAISFAVAMMFWKTAFMFVGRVIGLYVAMIFSPFAFLSRGSIPLVSKIDGISYASWWKDLTQYALLAPIFVFFLYIINSFLNVEFFNKIGLDQNAEGFFGKVMYVMIPMLIIYGLVTKAVGIAKRYSGYFGDLAQNFAVKATGVVGGAAIGLASGGLAYAGTRFGSRVGRALGQSRLGRRAAIAVARAQSNGTRASLTARLTNRALNWTQSSSWDPRNTKLGGVLRDNYLFKQMGLKPKDELTGEIGLGQKAFEGGYLAQQERRQKELRDEIENIKFSYLNDDQAKKLWKEIADAKVGDSAMKDYLDKNDSGFKATSDQEAQLKKEIKDAKKKIDDLEADIRTTNKLSEGDMEKAKNSLRDEKKSLSEKESKILDIQKAQLQTIKDIEADKNKLNTIRETDDYKKSWKDKTDELKKTYGKVETSKDLANAMRRDYAETLRNNSFWMKDGKQRKGLWAWGALGGGGLGALISGGISTAFGAIASEQIKFEQEALDAVTKKYIKDYSKGKGKLSKMDQYKNKIDEIKESLKKAIEAGTGIPTKDINLDDYDQSEQEKHVKARIDALRAEMDLQNEKYKKVADDYRANRNNITEKEVRDASAARKKAEDAHDEFKNLWKNKSETEEKIKKEEDKEKENK